MITPGGGTRLAAVLGWPVDHSLSPAMHNAAMEALGLDWLYVALPVPPGSLAAALLGARALGFGGLNLTLPHKVEALSLVDTVEASARRVGAINTVVIANEELRGANTDGAGWARSLAEEHPVDLHGSAVVLVGAGGAARSIAFAVVEAGAALRIANRDVARAEGLARDVRAAIRGAAVEARGLDRPLWSVDEGAPALVVQATTLGMGAVPGTDHWAGCERHWQDLVPAAPCPATVFSDLVYVPLRTPFLAAAEQRGAQLHGGVGMLVHQGALAFERWTGRVPPVDVMRRAVLARLPSPGSRA